LSKLEKLDISNTDINDGLECLPNSMKQIACFTTKKPDSKVKKIEQKLALYAIRNKGNYFDFQV